MKNLYYYSSAIIIASRERKSRRKQYVNIYNAQNVPNERDIVQFKK